MGINLRVPQNSVKVDGRNSSIYLSQNAIKGDDGGYYIPSIDSEGNLTWAPSETEMPAVGGTNIKGPKGDSGVWVGTETPDGDYNVWVKPDDEAIEIATKADLDGKQDKLTAGTNITIENNVISAAGGGSDEVWIGSEEPTGDQTVWIDPTGSETAGLVTQAELANKQDKLTAGTNITIDSNNVISATGGSGGSYTLPVANRHTLGGVKVESSGYVAELGRYVEMDEENKLYVPIPAAGLNNPGVISVSWQNFSLTRDSYGRECVLNLNKPEMINKYLGGVCPDGTTITMTDKGIISSVVPAATTSTLGGVKPDGVSITITADGTISSAASGLIGKSMAGYGQEPSEWGWIADWAQHPEKYYVVIRGIDGHGMDCPVIYTKPKPEWNKFYYYWFEDNTLHERYIDFTDNTLSQVKSVCQWADGGTVWLTQQNWQDYITAGGGSDWQVTTSTSDGNLYNAKEVVIFWQDSNYNRHQSYLNVGCDYWGNSGQTWGSSNWVNTEIRLDSFDNSYNGCSITYDGSNVNTSNCTIDAICYKT